MISSAKHCFRIYSVLGFVIINVNLYASYNLGDLVSDPLKGIQKFRYVKKEVLKNQYLLGTYLRYKALLLFNGKDSANRFLAINTSSANTDYMPITGGTFSGEVYFQGGTKINYFGISQSANENLFIDAPNGDIVLRPKTNTNNVLITNGSGLSIEGDLKVGGGTSLNYWGISQFAGGNLYIDAPDGDVVVRPKSYAKNVLITNGGGLSMDGNLSIGTGMPTNRALLDVGRHLSGGALSAVFARLSEGDNEGEGTYLGVKSWGSQPINSKSFSLNHSFGGQANSAINFYTGGGRSGGFMTFEVNNGTEAFRINPNGFIGIGVVDPTQALEVSGKIQTRNGSIATWDNLQLWSQGETSHIESNGDEIGLFIKSNRGQQIFLQNKVGIGITNTSIPLAEQLCVNGNIKTKKIIVTQLGWADHVFKSTYKLKPLSELEAYIKKYKHLPDVPSEQEVLGKDMDISETQVLLLKKIEELTLYVIELKKENNLLTKRILKLEKNKK